MTAHHRWLRLAGLLAALALAAAPIPAQPTAGMPLPLDAELYTPDAGRLRFALSDSAYVVVFELQPGRGARVLYPAGDAPERALGPGWHQPPWPTDDPLAGRTGTLLGTTGRARALYLVASRTPLGLPPGQRAPGALEAQTGPLVFQTTELPQLAGALVRSALTVPREDAAWIDALVYYQPGVADPLSAATRPAVRCADGREYPARTADGRPFVCP